MERMPKMQSKFMKWCFVNINMSYQRREKPAKNKQIFKSVDDYSRVFGS
jgi:hypothetical protein